VNNSGFIFMLCLGASLQVGILAVAHVSAHRQSKRLADRRARAAAELEARRSPFKTPSGALVTQTLLESVTAIIRAAKKQVPGVDLQIRADPPVAPHIELERETA
jgi:hypothetical protein